MNAPTTTNTQRPHLGAAAVGLDDFDFQTRYVPGLLALAPLAVVGIAYGLHDNKTVLALLSLAGLIGLPRLLVGLVRDAGSNIEADLWASWGGKPTTRMLRLADVTIGAADKARWRERLAAHGEVTFPETIADELADPDGADELYEQAVAAARIRLKGDELVAIENRNYNFQRSLIGLRPYALVASVASVVALATGIWASASGPSDVGQPLVIGLVAAVALLGVWTWAPSTERTRKVAEKYARQLLVTAAAA